MTHMPMDIPGQLPAFSGPDIAARGSQRFTQYTALYDSLRSRRLRPILPKGLDRAWVQGSVVLGGLAKSRAWFWEEARQTAALNTQYRSMSDGALAHEIELVREHFLRRRQSTQHVRHALAMVREIARRETGEEPYPVQLMGALAMYHGRIIEMLTGEGKTLTGSIAAPIIAWQYRRLHVLTVNDYLASRDAESRAGIYRRCLLDVGAITQETDHAERPAIYARAIVYGTPKQIVADWLRDQIRLAGATSAWAARRLAEAGEGLGGGAGPMVPGLKAAMVDEADAVLIDEGVVPLIIARPRREDEMSGVYREASRLAQKLDQGPDYEIDHLRRRATLKLRGEQRSQQLFADAVARGANPIWKATRRGEELVRQALVARHCYVRGSQYEVVDGKIVIVDEYTGRFLADRSWEHGLHQAVEAKEGVDVTADRETLARLSFQRYFRSYPFLCGMTGTAADATHELEGTYSRPVVVVPTNRPSARAHMPTRIFRTQRDKWDAVADSIERIHKQGRPILVGTRSITASEIVAQLLSQRGLVHQVLNANFDKEEAQFIAGAGKHGAITVATNMAGRGTDIKLDDDARKAGGLHVLLTEMHGATRIDRQFIGRAGRQGDPGSAQIFVSLEDELMQKYAKWPARLLRQRTTSAEITLTPGVIALFRLAQARNQSRDRRNRANVLRQDDWIDKHLPGSG
jgi:preprotein translocase subunit SecA